MYQLMTERTFLPACHQQKATLTRRTKSIRSCGCGILHPNYCKKVGTTSAMGGDGVISLAIICFWCHAHCSLFTVHSFLSAETAVPYVVSFCSTVCGTAMRDRREQRREALREPWNTYTTEQRSQQTPEQKHCRVCELLTWTMVDSRVFCSTASQNDLDL